MSVEEIIIEFEMRGPGPPGHECTPTHKRSQDF